MIITPMPRGEFSPLNVPNCALWLEADRGVTLVSGAVSAWADQSGNGYHYSQTSATDRPAWNATAINGKPGIVFGASFDALNAVSPANISNNQTFFFLMSSSVDGRIYYTNTYVLNISLGKPQVFSFGGTLTWGVAPASPFVLIFKWTTNSQYLAVNTGAGLTASVAVPITVDIRIGRADSLAFQGSFGAVLRYSKVTSPAEDQYIIGGLCGRYGVVL